MTTEIHSRITQLRHQLLVHSCLYYRMDKNIISDYSFDKRSVELVELQTQYPKIASECVYHEHFKDFEGSTGVYLPYHLDEVTQRALKLLNYHNKKGDNKC